MNIYYNNGYKEDIVEHYKDRNIDKKVSLRYINLFSHISLLRLISGYNIDNGTILDIFILLLNMRNHNDFNNLYDLLKENIDLEKLALFRSFDKFKDLYSFENINKDKMHERSNVYTYFDV